VSSKRKKDILCYVYTPCRPAIMTFGFSKESMLLWFGYRVWASSWLLMDFRNAAPCRPAVMYGAGLRLGLAGIYCARRSVPW